MGERQKYCNDFIVSLKSVECSRLQISFVDGDGIPSCFYKQIFVYEFR